MPDWEGPLAFSLGSLVSPQGSFPLFVCSATFYHSPKVLITAAYGSTDLCLRFLLVGVEENQTLPLILMHINPLPELCIARSEERSLWSQSFWVQGPHLPPYKLCDLG